MEWYWLVLVLVASCIYSSYAMYLQTRVVCKYCHLQFHAHPGKGRGNCPQCNIEWKR